MARLVAVTRLKATDGRAYSGLICGRHVNHGWEGWLEFLPVDGSSVFQTPRETTQPNFEALEHWAGGLTSVYLDGALTRAIHAARVPDLAAGGAGDATLSATRPPATLGR